VVKDKRGGVESTSTFNLVNKLFEQCAVDDNSTCSKILLQCKGWETLS